MNEILYMEHNKIHARETERETDKQRDRQTETDERRQQPIKLSNDWLAIASLTKQKQNKNW